MPKDRQTVRRENRVEKRGEECHLPPFCKPQDNEKKENGICGMQQSVGDVVSIGIEADEVIEQVDVETLNGSITLRDVRRIEELYQIAREIHGGSPLQVPPAVVKADLERGKINNDADQGNYQRAHDCPRFRCDELHGTYSTTSNGPMATVSVIASP